MGSTREFEFVVGPETSTIPTAGTPSADDDTITKGFADDNYVQGAQPVADLTALAAVAVADRKDNDLRFVDAKELIYYFDSASADADDGDTVIAPDAGTGRWKVISGGGGGAGGLTTATLSSGGTLANNTHYLVDSSGGSFTSDLPAGSAGAVIRMSDVTDSWDTFPVTVDGDAAETINGDLTLVMDVKGSWVQFMWDGSDWKTDDNIDPAAASSSPPDSSIFVDSGNGHGSTNNKIRRFSNTRLTAGTDITYADSATLGGSFTINQDGVYSITYSDRHTAENNIGISVNTSAPTTGVSAITYAQGRRTYIEFELGDVICSSITLLLSSGDVVRAHTNGNNSNTSKDVYFSITQCAKT